MVLIVGTMTEGKITVFMAYWAVSLLSSFFLSLTVFSVRFLHNFAHPIAFAGLRKSRINWKTFVCLTSYYRLRCHSTLWCSFLFSVDLLVINSLQSDFELNLPLKKTHTNTHLMCGLWLNTIDRKWNELNWHHQQMKGICLNAEWILFKWKEGTKMSNIFIIEWSGKEEILFYKHGMHRKSNK